MPELLYLPVRTLYRPCLNLAYGRIEMSVLMYTAGDSYLIVFTQLDIILGRFGTFIIERAGSDVDEALDGLSVWRENIYVIRQMIHNDVSSTKIRLFLRRGMSVHYLLPDSVIRYIEQNHLYVDDHKDKTAAGSDADTPTADRQQQSEASTSTARAT